MQAEERSYASTSTASRCEVTVKVPSDTLVAHVRRAMQAFEAELRRQREGWNEEEN